jgi:hypothetical protein
MSECEHKHQVGNLNSQWWCKDCGKGLTPNAKDRRLIISKEEIQFLISKHMGYLSFYDNVKAVQFAEELIKLAKEIKHG